MDSKPINVTRNYRQFADTTVSAFAILAQLFKLRLSLLVVFSSIMGAIIVGGIQILSFADFVLLFVGGILTSGSGSAVNQLLEKDSDKLMARTMDRPLAKNQVGVPLSILIIGVSLIGGLFSLYLINESAAMLAIMAWILYGFVYTPMKKMTPFAVFVGAVPGALPVLTGSVAVQGEITLLSFLLFSVQFIWQFPHFWAIAWLADKDYKKAGFKLLPNVKGEKDESVAWQCFVYSLLLIPISGVLWYNGLIGLTGFLVLNIFNTIYAYFSWSLYCNLSDKAAKKLMFYSFFYLPAFLIFLSLLIH